jgi:hypothetical protein
VVSIGDGSDVPFLRNIATLGKGRFHLTDKAANLPTIFTEETALAQRSYIVEQDFFPQQGNSSPILSGITQVPALQGYIASTAKPAAQVVLRANESDPLLATWQYGLGRAVAFTSDATGRWGKNWVQWDEFPRFWAQAIRWTILERGQSTLQAGVQQRGDQTVIVADVPEGRASDDLKLNATVIDSDGRSREVTLQQTAPGRYEAATYLDQAGAYFVRVNPVISGTAAPTATNTLGEATVAYVRPYSPEYAQTTGGTDALSDWASLGGGGTMNGPADAFVLNAPVAASRTDLFPWLLALAAILLPFDVGVRRITVSLRKLFGREAQLATATAGAADNSRVTQLMQAKGRTTFSQPAPRSAPATSTPTTSPPQPDAAQQAPVHTAPPQAAATASELLKRRRQRTQDDAGEKKDEQK